jgi:hypothetical protein
MAIISFLITAFCLGDAVEAAAAAAAAAAAPC